MRGLPGMREMFCNWFGVMLIGVCIIVRIHQTEHVKSICFTVIWLCLSKCVWIENCKYLTKLLNHLNVILSQTHLRRKKFKLFIQADDFYTILSSQVLCGHKEGELPRLHALQYIFWQCKTDFQTAWAYHIPPANSGHLQLAPLWTWFLC